MQKCKLSKTNLEESQVGFGEFPLSGRLQLCAEVLIWVLTILIPLDGDREEKIGASIQGRARSSMVKSKLTNVQKIVTNVNQDALSAIN